MTSFPINIVSHQGKAQGQGKIALLEKAVSIDISIYDDVNSDTSTLSYELTNTDFNTTNTEIVGTVIQDGNVRVEKMHLVNHLLKIKSNKPFKSGKISIMANIAVHNYNFHSSEPGSGCRGSGCR
jgi:hypothetical protein